MIFRIHRNALIHRAMEITFIWPSLTPARAIPITECRDVCTNNVFKRYLQLDLETSPAYKPQAHTWLVHKHRPTIVESKQAWTPGAEGAVLASDKAMPVWPLQRNGYVDYATFSYTLLVARQRQVGKGYFSIFEIHQHAYLSTL